MVLIIKPPFLWEITLYKRTDGKIRQEIDGSCSGQHKRPPRESIEEKVSRKVMDYAETAQRLLKINRYVPSGGRFAKLDTCCKIILTPSVFRDIMNSVARLAWG
jgi:hypothetical protein